MPLINNNLGIVLIIVYISKALSLGKLLRFLKGAFIFIIDVKSIQGRQRKALKYLIEMCHYTYL